MVVIFLRNWKPKLEPKLKRNMHRDKHFPKNVKGSFIRELSKNVDGKYVGIDIGVDV